VNLDIDIDAKKGDQWDGKHHPCIEITFDDDGNAGIWVKDGPDGLVVAWCDLPPSIIRTIAAVAQTWPMQPEGEK
jgi:hypothetical protein